MSLDNTIEILRRANERTAAIKARVPGLSSKQIIDDDKNIPVFQTPPINEASQLQSQDYARSQDSSNPSYV